MSEATTSVAPCADPFRDLFEASLLRAALWGLDEVVLLRTLPGGVLVLEPAPDGVWLLPPLAEGRSLLLRFCDLGNCLTVVLITVAEAELAEALGGAAAVGSSGAAGAALADAMAPAPAESHADPDSLPAPKVAVESET